MSEKYEHEERDAVIVAWWVDHLRGNQKDGDTVGRIAADTNVPAGPAILAMMQKSRHTPEEKIEAFATHLKRLLREGPDAETHPFECHKWPVWFNLTVDYDPQGLLARAAKLAGLSLHALPWKTRMYVDKNDVFISREGKSERLWPLQEEQ